MSDETRLSVMINIMPFGRISLNGVESINSEPLIGSPILVYQEPESTNESFIEIEFDGSEYSMPLSTAGF